MPTSAREGPLGLRAPYPCILLATILPEGELRFVTLASQGRNFSKFAAIHAAASTNPPTARPR